MNLRWPLISALLVVVLGLVSGTSGLSATVVDRGVQASVVNDDDAYLGFKQDAVTTNETTNLTITITNQFPAGTTLDTVRVTVDRNEKCLGPLDPGDQNSTTFESVDCDGSLSVVASGVGVEVALDREACE
jgi:hypothetical protein